MGNESMFDRYVGIDYSGTNTPVARINGLAVCVAGPRILSGVVSPGKDECDLWSRRLLAEWLEEILLDRTKRTLVGIDHGFGFPTRYFKKYPDILEGIKDPGKKWESFLEDFRKHWKTDDDEAWVSEVVKDRERPRQGGRKWLRETDKEAIRQGFDPASVFDFWAKKRNVAHSTHAGLPWLLYIRQQLKKKYASVCFWPFDTWDVDDYQSVVLEVYPALWNELFENPTWDRGWRVDRHWRDAYSVALWMWERDCDAEDSLKDYFTPGIPEGKKEQASTEGWIFGVRCVDGSAAG